MSRWVYPIRLSGDGKRLAVGYANGTAEVWDLTTRQVLVRTEPQAGSINGVAFHPDGTMVMTVCGDGTVQGWDIRTGERAGQMFRVDGIAYGLAFSPDGEICAVESHDPSVILFDARTGERLSTPQDGMAAPHCVAFSPDGKRLLIGQYGAPPVVMDVPPRPRSVREMELRTWVNLGIRYSASGSPESIAPAELNALREELRALEAETR